MCWLCFVLSVLQPIKMMRYRGSDDDVIGFGHFSEIRRVKSGPSDVIVPITARKSHRQTNLQLVSSKFNFFEFFFFKRVTILMNTLRKKWPRRYVLLLSSMKERFRCLHLVNQGFNNGRPDPRSLKNGGGVNRFGLLVVINSCLLLLSTWRQYLNINIWISVGSLIPAASLLESTNRLRRSPTGQAEETTSSTRIPLRTRDGSR